LPQTPVATVRKQIAAGETGPLYMLVGADDVVTVINEVRKLGVDKIGLVADKKKGGAAAAKATS